MGHFCQHTAIDKDHIKIIRNINSNVSDCLSLFESPIALLLQWNVFKWTIFFVIMFIPVCL